MISVETLPVRMDAVQWHQPGDCDLVKPYRLGQEERYGIHAPTGFQRVTPGDWIVVSNGATRVYANEEFWRRFRVVEEEQGS